MPNTYFFLHLTLSHFVLCLALVFVSSVKSYKTDESRTPSLPTAVANMSGPPHGSGKRKYGDEQMDDRISCDEDHMTKMSRLFATQL